MKTVNVPSPNYSSRYKPGPKLIVLHHTASARNSGGAIASMFRNKTAQVSAHEVVDSDGTRYHCVDWSKRAWHAGSGSWHGQTDTNSLSLGIEIVNLGNGKDPYSNAQLKTVATLIRQMQKKYPSIEPWNIVDHESISTAGKVDLRKNFPAEKLMWMVLHPNLPVPNKANVAPWMLPKWARRVASRIKMESGPINK
jgi:N-acetylmuramoyl-L-alanine amidase